MAASMMMRSKWRQDVGGASDRIAWIDAARGIGIILVVIGHVERGLVAAGIAQGPTWSWMDYALYTFHMPLFFLLAGVNVPASLARGRRRFFTVKLWTIAYPYVLWSLIQGSVLVVLASLTNSQTHISDLLEIGWRPIAQFWFLYALMVCQLVALLVASRPTLLAGGALVTWVGAAVLEQGGIVEETLHAFPFFACGILVSARCMKWRATQCGDMTRAVLAALGLAAAIPLSAPLDGFNFDAAGALPASICGIVLLISLARLLAGPVLRAAAWLGRISMTIYVLHILAAAGARIGMLKLHVAPNPWLYLVVCSLVGLVASAIVHLVLARLRLLAPLGLALLQRQVLPPWRHLARPLPR